MTSAPAPAPAPASASAPASAPAPAPAPASPVVVVVGGGHAAAQFCASMVEGGFGGRLVLVSDEPHLPYHRPPLSKTLIKDPAAGLPELRGRPFYDDAGIELRLSTRALAIDRAARTLAVRGADGADASIAYDHLVLATGARARALPSSAGDAVSVQALRHYDDARRLRDALAQVERVLVIGGGYIGLELAASARTLGKTVTVIEAAPRLLARTASPQIAAHLLDTHRGNGIDIRLGGLPERIELDARGHAGGVVLHGEALRADLLIAGVGAVPNVELGRDAGLACDNGIVVDAMLQTSDAAVSAIGDCTSFPYHGVHLRLEAVQNANDQAKALAARLLGRPQPYTPVPWFWSDQGDVRLQITGLWNASLQAVRREAARAGAFSLFHYAGERLVAVESVNAPPDHMIGRRWLQSGHSPPPDALADPQRALKTL